MLQIKVIDKKSHFPLFDYNQKRRCTIRDIGPIYKFFFFREISFGFLRMPAHPHIRTDIIVKFGEMDSGGFKTDIFAKI